MGRLAARTRRWSRYEYERLIDLGALTEDEPIELIEGRLVVAEPQKTPHAIAIELVAEALRTAFGAGWRVRVQLPLAASEDSEPEPDVAVVRGTPRDSRHGHPASAALVVEVAQRSLALDRGPKARVYAGAGIADYWIVNLVDGLVEVRREPVAGPRGRPRYTSLLLGRPGEVLTPLAAPTARIAVADLLP